MGGSELRDFIIKRLNMWSRNIDDNFIDNDKWSSCKSDRTLKEIAESGYTNCFVGIDLSSGGDLTSIAIEIPVGDHFYIYSHSFMPKGRVDEHIQTDIAPYDIWVEKELLTITGGEVEYKNDYKFILSHLRNLVEQYHLNIKAIGYDPHNADYFLSDLEEFGAPLLMITQSARFLNDGTNDMRLNIKSGKVEYHKENELLSWSVSNAKLVYNSFGEMKIDKEPRAKYKRIDPVDALIDAHITYMKFVEELDLSKEMENYLEQIGWNMEVSS